MAESSDHEEYIISKYTNYQDYIANHTGKNYYTQVADLSLSAGEGLMLLIEGKYGKNYLTDLNLPVGEDLIVRIEGNYGRYYGGYIHYTLPAGTTGVDCRLCNIIFELPTTLRWLLLRYVAHCTINSMFPSLPSRLTCLIVSDSNLTKLPILPATLLYLNCAFNDLTSIDVELPAGLIYFNCSFNKLKCFNVSLPRKLLHFLCSYNSLVSLPSLPSGLKTFVATKFWEYTNISALPILPHSLVLLMVDDSVCEYYGVKKNVIDAIRNKQQEQITPVRARYYAFLLAISYWRRASLDIRGLLWRALRPTHI